MESASAQSEVPPRNGDLYCDLRKLHCLFGLSACAFFVATLLLVAVDHNREWKRHQSEYREKLAPLLQAIDDFDRAVAEAPSSEGFPEFVPPRQRPWWARVIFGTPFFEPFAHRFEVEEVAAEGLPLVFPTGSAPRRDRCTTCHQGMSPRQTLSARSVDLLPERSVWVRLVVGGPEAAVEPGSEGDHRQLGEGASGVADSLRSLAWITGLFLADVTFLGKKAVIVTGVRPATVAAEAGFLPGDRVVSVGSETAQNARQAARSLLASLETKGSAEVLLRRGLSHPYAAHPYPEVFVTAGSHHPVERFGCTVCHEGNGSATGFVSAGHRGRVTGGKSQPRDYPFAPLAQGDHWPWPMLPTELVESSCLSCHHRPESFALEVWAGSELGRRWLHGYRTVLQRGCFGCHEIKVPANAAGESDFDLRLEPPWHELASRVLESAEDLGPYVRSARTLRRSPWNQAAQWAFQTEIENWAGERPGGATTRQLPDQADDQPALWEKEGGLGLAETKEADELLRWVRLLSVRKGEGGLGVRKVGPSLRFAAWKLSPEFVAAYLWNPRTFSQFARMPRFFGLYDHLTDAERLIAFKLETAEIYAIVYYLTGESASGAEVFSNNPIARLAPAEVPAGDPASGARHFRRQGCIACHRHGDFIDATSDFGPDLTHFASKVRSEIGARWLWAWLVDPAEISPRTNMPRVLFKARGIGDDPETVGVGLGRTPGSFNATLGGLGRLADVSEEVKQGKSPRLLPETVGHDIKDDTLGKEVQNRPARADAESPHPDAEATRFLSAEDRIRANLVAFLLQDRGLPPPEFPSLDREVVRELTELYLKPLCSPEEARRFAADGIPSQDLPRFGADERLLEAPADDGAKLRYIARKSMRRRGCAACHEIPGLEVFSPIGPPLTGWRDKGSHLLDLGEFGLKAAVRDCLAREAQFEKGPLAFNVEGGGGSTTGSESFSQRDPSGPEAVHLPGFFGDFVADRKEGFLWLKLQRPRSFDFGRTDTRPFTSWLQMPQFDWTEEELLGVMTFVLSLPGRASPSGARQPPAPDEVRIADGLRLLDCLGCANCHMLDPERIAVEYSPEELELPPEELSFEWLKTRVKPGVRPEESSRRGTLSAQLVGFLERDEGWKPLSEPDPEDIPTFFLNLWSPWAVWRKDHWAVWEVGGPQVIVGDSGGIIGEGARWAAGTSPLVPPVWLKGDWTKEAARLPTSSGLTPLVPSSTPDRATRESEGNPRPTWDRGERVRELGIGKQQIANSAEAPRDRSAQFAEVVPPKPHQVPTIRASRAAVGGRILHMLGPDVVAELGTSATDALNYLPPPLVRQGEATPSSWVAQYLLRPTEIRPSVIFPMPQYNLSPAEAAAIAEFFDAYARRQRARSPTWDPGELWSELVATTSLRDERKTAAGVGQPYLQGQPDNGEKPAELEAELGEHSDRNGADLPPDSRDNPLQAMATWLDGEATSLGISLLPDDVRREKRWIQAFRLVVDRRTFCGKCHPVGDQSPGELSTSAIGPRLDGVAGRLRGEYLRRWLAEPRRILPYTTMPANFPPSGPRVGQELLPGPPESQVEAVADLLLHYPEFLRKAVSISTILEKITPSADSDEPLPSGENQGAAQRPRDLTD